MKAAQAEPGIEYIERITQRQGLKFQTIGNVCCVVFLFYIKLLFILNYSISAYITL